MKAILCGYCNDIKALSPKSPVTCECGNVTGWWVDSEKGIAKLSAKAKGVVRVIGINNSFLVAGFNNVYMNGSMSDKEWRDLSEETCKNAEGYLFHKDRRNCPLVIIKVGESSDISWDEG
jgi:hypothetical protein